MAMTAETGAAELQELKGRPGRNAMIIGSASLVRSLLGTGAIDELVLLVFPVVVGGGKKLFDEQAESLPLELLGCETFGRGVVKLVYRPRIARTPSPDARGT